MADSTYYHKYKYALNKMKQIALHFIAAVLFYTFQVKWGEWWKVCLFPEKLHSPKLKEHRCRNSRKITSGEIIAISRTWTISSSINSFPFANRPRHVVCSQSNVSSSTEWICKIFHLLAQELNFLVYFCFLLLVYMSIPKLYPYKIVCLASCSELMATEISYISI